MTDDEFDVLDDLYFVVAFEELAQLTGRSADELIPILDRIYRKGWIKVLRTPDDELSPDQVNLEHNAGDYFYLATKKGLMAHNS